MDRPPGPGPYDIEIITTPDEEGESSKICFDECVDPGAAPQPRFHSSSSSSSKPEEECNGGEDPAFFIEDGNVAAAGKGETIELEGEGAFYEKPKELLSGSGTFVQRDANGVVLADGTWEATDLVNYQTYGPATPEQSAAESLPPGSEGGTALIRIDLSTGSEGMLRVTSVHGSPPGGADEGIQVKVKGGPNFSKELTGDILFVHE